MDKTKLAQVRAAVSEYAENVQFNKERTIMTCKRGYYYRHGMTAESLARRIVKLLARHDVVAQVNTAEDHFNPWPRDSFFKVVLSIREDAERAKNILEEMSAPKQP